MAEPEIIEEWLKRAGEDFEFASSNLKDRNQFFGQICFHCLLSPSCRDVFKSFHHSS